MAKSDNEGNIPEFNVEPRFPEHLRETMSKLSLRQQQLLYLDIFKPLDFNELLFQKCFKKSSEEQPPAAVKNSHVCYRGQCRRRKRLFAVAENVTDKNEQF